MALERFAHGVFRRLGVQVNRPDDSVFHLVQARDSSWRGTRQQYVGRLHRARADKSEVRVYDYDCEHEDERGDDYEDYTA